MLQVRDLATRFGPEPGVRAVDGVSFDLRRGRTTALVGESGCGKSATALSIMRLIPRPGAVVGGSVIYRDNDLRQLSEPAMRAVRGARIGMVFQDPMRALNPAARVGGQIAETLLAHEPVGRAAATRRAVELLGAVGIADPERRARDYPHQFSGGMRQRVLIAAAIACAPEIVIADEPTTALDVTVQAAILKLLHERQRAMGASLLLITHDLGVVASMADEVVVMYAGRVVERAAVDTLFHAARHPYTRALLGCVLGIEDDRSVPLKPIAGAPPSLRDPPPGCRFAPRCTLAEPVCHAREPALRPHAHGHDVRCWVAEREVAFA